MTANRQSLFSSTPEPGAEPRGEVEVEVDLSRFTPRARPIEERATKEALERTARESGFESRQAPKKRGRPPSKRTGQVHAHVMPDVAKKISLEARRRGIQQGVLIEEALAFYERANGIIDLDPT